MCDPVSAAVGIGVGLLGFKASNDRNDAARDAARQQDQVNKENRKRNWFQQLSVYGAKTNVYEQDIQEADSAVARGYDQAQRGLNAVYASAIQENIGTLGKYLEGSGTLAASGKTGRSADRVATLDIAKMEREAAQRAYAVIASKESFKENVKDIKRKAVSYKNKKFANIAFAPTPDTQLPNTIAVTENSLLSGLTAGLSAAVPFIN